MSFQEGDQKPPQSDVNAYLKQERRRSRRQRPVYVFPDSPVVIPAERAEKARTHLESVYGLWEEGQHYTSLVKWFTDPNEIRDDAIAGVLLQENLPSRSLSSAQFYTRGKPSNLVLQHYPLLTVPTVRKLIIPEDSDLFTEEDVFNIAGNADEKAKVEFALRLRFLGLADDAYKYYDRDDFPVQGRDIISNFTVEDERLFLVNLVPHLSGHSKRMLLSNNGVVSGIKHADLLADPRLADQLENPMLREGEWIEHLENFIAQSAYPSAQFFEEAFKRLKPEDSDPQAVFKVSIKDIKDTPIPSSAYYFTMLRNMVHLEETRRQLPGYAAGREDRIVGYLLSDSFMSHVMPYLKFDTLYSDNLIWESNTSITYHADPEAQGSTAIQLKRVKLLEVIRSAIGYAQKSGDQKTATKLAQKYVDYLS